MRAVNVQFFTCLVYKISHEKLFLLVITLSYHERSWAEHCSL